MARQELPREDLLRDATALSPRLLMAATGVDERVFAGFRNNALSLFFSDDPAYHCNGQGSLRRAFVDGQLLKAVDGVLVALERNRTATEVQLRPIKWEASEQSRRLQHLQRRLEQLRSALAGDRIEVLGQHPADGDGLDRLRAWLDAHREIKVARSPRIS